MNDLDKLIAYSQRNITYGYLGLFTGSLAALLLLPKPLDETINTLLVTLLSVLGTILVQQSSFWFARQRTAGIPDPNPPQVGPVANVENMTVETKPVATPPKESP